MKKEYMMQRRIVHDGIFCDATCAGMNSRFHCDFFAGPHPWDREKVKQRVSQECLAWCQEEENKKQFDIKEMNLIKKNNNLYPWEQAPEWATWAYSVEIGDDYDSRWYGDEQSTTIEGFEFPIDMHPCESYERRPIVKK